MFKEIYIFVFLSSLVYWYVECYICTLHHHSDVHSEELICSIIIIDSVHRV